MRKRKILSFLLASSLMSAWGQSVDDLRVTLHLKDATVKTLFEALHEQTSLNFVYNNEQTKTLPLITIQVKDKSVEEVLKQVFAQTAFSYEVSDNTVTLFRSPSGQRRVQKVSGVVKDAHIQSVNIHRISSMPKIDLGFSIFATLKITTISVLIRTII